MKTFLDITEETLREMGKPLTPREIWDMANELNLTDGYETKDKTPWASIGAQLGRDIKKQNSKFARTSERPAHFFLKNVTPIIEDETEEVKDDRSFHERDLHPLLVAYTNTDTHFKAYLKTIFHENSKREKKGMNKWLHPDLVGVYFPFDEFEKEVIDIQKQISTTSIKLFSFEMKIELGFSNLRECYFQAVSNSSWANEGYLVTSSIDDDPEFLDEVRRLNNAFGIGVIKLSLIDIFESEILFPSKEKNYVDWDTANRLTKDNKDFKKFLEDVKDDIIAGKVKSKYDEILTEEKMIKYIKNKNIYAWYGFFKKQGK